MTEAEVDALLVRLRRVVAASVETFRWQRAAIVEARSELADADNVLHTLRMEQREWDTERANLRQKVEDLRRDLARADREALQRLDAHNERERGWANRVRGLEEELRRRGWPDVPAEAVGTALANHERGWSSKEEWTATLEIEKLRTAVERAKASLKIAQTTANGLRASYATARDQLHEMTLRWEHARDRLARLGMDRAFPTGLQLPDGVTVNDVIALTHPDRHSPDRAGVANRVTAWLLTLRGRP